MNSITEVILSLKDAILSLQPSKSWTDYITPIGVIITAFGVIFGIYKILSEIANQKKIFSEAQNQKERENITRKLNLFFGPLKELRAESKILYDHFALKEKSAFGEKEGKRFRTLRHLAQRKSFSNQDNAILKNILEVGKKQLQLIEKEGHIIDNSQLAELLGKLGAHIRVLGLAAENKLDGMSEEFEDLVFPREVDGALESEVRKLQDNYKKLKNPFEKKKISMKLSREQAITISYYNQNAQSYFRETAYIDLKEIYDEFLENISFGGIILDAGCGVGRDTRFFIKEGYRVISFDASIEMVKLCNQYPFAYCLHKTFADIDYIEEFDGIWACSSLIHLSQGDFTDALQRLYNATKPGGVIYFSLKVRNEKAESKLRNIYYYGDDFIQNIMTETLMLELIKISENKGKKQLEISDWKNYFYRKPKTVG